MHFAAGHELQIEGARLIQELIPWADRVRFTSPGPEATPLAIRLARASSGKGKIVRFVSHFHGWHDHAAFGVKEPLDGTPTAGVLPEVAANVILIKPNDVAGIARVLAEHGEVA